MRNRQHQVIKKEDNSACGIKAQFGISVLHPGYAGAVHRNP